MRIHRWTRLWPAASATVFLLAVFLWEPSGASAQAPVPVISLKKFIDVAQWQLDITWSGKDVYSDADQNAKLDFMATARFILTRLDKQDAWGRWQALNVQSTKFAFNSFLVHGEEWRLDYKSTNGPVMSATAVLQVGGSTPGYELDCLVAFPLQVTGLPGTSLSGLALTTIDPGNPGPSGTCGGPLPADGDSIHGSITIPLDIVPFGGLPLPKTRVGIQFVLQPFQPLTPVTPPKKK